MGETHIQVINPDSYIDDSDEINIQDQLVQYVTKDLIDDIHELDERSNCPITWNFGPNKNGQVTGGLDIMKQYVEENLEESLDLSGYEELTYPLRDGGKNYQLFRKLENGKGKWAAAPMEMGDVKYDDAFEITYDQARGFEPINNIGKLSRDLGKMLLPQRESMNEASYGGAYDIEDDMYFTKEELIEFAGDLAEQYCAWANHEKVYIEDLYIAPGNWLTIELYDDDEGIYIPASVRIDMRKIKLPKDIYKYSDIILKQWKDSYNEYHEYDEELFNESLDDDNPYTYEQMEKELKSATNDWTIDNFEGNVAYENEFDYSMDILSHHYENVDHWEDGNKFWFKATRPSVFESLNEEYWDSSRVRDLVQYYLDRYDDLDNDTLFKLIITQMKKEDSVLPASLNTIRSYMNEIVDDYWDFRDNLSNDDYKLFYSSDLDETFNEDLLPDDVYDNFVHNAKKTYSVGLYSSGKYKKLNPGYHYEINTQYGVYTKVPENEGYIAHWFIQSLPQQSVEDMERVTNNIINKYNCREVSLDEYKQIIDGKKSVSTVGESLNEASYEVEYLEDELAEKSQYPSIENAYQRNELTICKFKNRDVYYIERCPNRIYKLVRKEMGKYYPELTYLYNESLQEAKRLNNHEKEIYINALKEAEDREDLEDIVHEIFFYDKGLFTLLRHFPKDMSFEQLRDKLIEIIQSTILDEDLKIENNVNQFKKGQKVLYNGKETFIKEIDNDPKYGVDLLIKNPDWDGKDERFEYIWVADNVEVI